MAKKSQAGKTRSAILVLAVFVLAIFVGPRMGCASITLASAQRGRHPRAD